MDELLFAPLEGITGGVFRRIYHRHFKGVSEFYTPFITPKAKRGLDKRDISEILPGNNEGMKLIPQILTNDAEAFNLAALKLFDFGYMEVNLNLGCPSGTVVNKLKGSGALKDLNRLDALLAGIFSFSEKKGMRISVKSRIGYESPEEFSDILSIYLKYPLSQLILHPRTRAEFYKGEIHYDSFSEASHRYAKDACKLTFNGDIRSTKDFLSVKSRFPEISSFMIGRGFLASPFLAEDLRALTTEGGDRRERLKTFLDELFFAYTEDAKNEGVAVLKLKEIWSHLGASFVDKGGFLKEVRKAKNAAEYKAYVNVLFSNCDFIYESLEKSL